MLRGRRTLGGMDEDLERLLAYVADVVLEQGGDWDATFAMLRQSLHGSELVIPDGDDLMKAQILAVGLLNEYEEPGLGPQVVRDRRDRRRRLVPVQPTQRRWRWRATG
jgi:hypothetical protein